MFEKLTATQKLAWQLMWQIMQAHNVTYINNEQIWLELYYRSNLMPGVGFQFSSNDEAIQ